MEKIYLSTGIHNPPTGTEDMDCVNAYTFFPDDFMQSYTKHKSIVSFIEAIGSAFSESESEKLNNGDYDDLICKHSDFKSWEAMLEAVRDYHEDRKDI